ncbi:cilia- and flagella-associated protein 157-like [Diadema setosum]|uniref:cilia- and flagella-associated protein 157-like n=1 Tax=Diadema setosum TaxID=31175 RepID=UPI003B3ABB2D
MPPKKKGGKKKGKKSGKKSGKRSARASSAPDGQNLSEVGKEYFLIQIRDLERRLARYQRKCDELEVANGEFRSRYDQMGTDKKEIVAFLKKQLEQRQDEIADLNDRLVGLQQAKDTEKDSYEAQLAQLRNEFQETKDQLTSENMILSGKLAALEEFKVQKEDLKKKFEQMEEELEKQADEHKDEIYKLEKKQVVDKDRLKREMVLRVNQVAAEFRKVSNKQMADTTKRTIRENVSIHAQLAKMSDKTMELIEENEELRAKEKKQRQQLEMLETNEKELAKKNHSNQKVIRMLTEKAKQQEDLIADLEEREKEYQEMEAEMALLRQQADSSREELQTMGREADQMQERMEMMEREKAELAEIKIKLERILAEAAYSLHRILMGNTSKVAPSGSLNLEEVEKRDNMLEHLLVILNSAAAIGVGPSPEAFIPTEEEFYRTKSRETMYPGSGKGLKRGYTPLSPIAKGAGTLPHYRMGDLGLVPRPKPSTFPSDTTRQLSATSRLNRLQGVKSRSVGIQTTSSAKAVFRADQLLGSDTTAAKSALIQELALTHKQRPLAPVMMPTGKVTR